MGLEDIIDKINADAETEAERIKAEAQEKLKAAIARVEKDVASQRERALESARRELEEEKKRRMALAQLEWRKALLKEKRKLLGEVFERALAALAKMDGEGYSEWLKKLVQENVETGDEEIVISKKDQEYFNKAFLAELNKSLTKNGKKGELRLSAQPGKFQRGIVLRGNRREVNCTLEAIVASRREELEAAVSPILFPAE